MERKELATRIGRNVILLGIISFLNDASSEIIRPILPLLIVALGGNELILGLISGLMESTSSLLKVFSGYISDRVGKRKPIVFSGYLASAVFKLLLSVSTVWYHIMIFATFERVGKGIRTAPRDAIISESMPERKGKGFGIHRALDTAGAVLGACMAFILTSLMGFAYTRSILIAAILSFISLIPFLWVREVRRVSSQSGFFRGLKEIPPYLKKFLLVAGIFAFANISYMFFMRRAQVVYENDNSVLLLYILFNISYAIFAYPFGVLSDRVGRKNVLVSGYILFAIVFIGFTILSSEYGLVLLFLLYGLVYAIVDANQRAFVSDLSTENIRATSLGLFHTTVGIIALPAGMIAGYLWTEFGYHFTFLYGFAMSLIAAFLLILFFRKEE
ncbi:MAG: MFS transporter [Thermoplasmata archaeon]|nr:MFS transporter [Thermoplasmata archaeon]